MHFLAISTLEDSNAQNNMHDFWIKYVFKNKEWFDSRMKNGSRTIQSLVEKIKLVVMVKIKFG